jgi:hypothetical protein
VLNVVNGYWSTPTTEVPVWPIARAVVRNGQKHMMRGRMSDKDFLQWILSRLEHVHGENPNYDYMQKLQAIINSYVEWDILSIQIIKQAIATARAEAEAKYKADADRLAEALRLYIGDDYKCTWWERRDKARAALAAHERGEG